MMKFHIANSPVSWHQMLRIIETWVPNMTSSSIVEYKEAMLRLQSLYSPDKRDYEPYVSYKEAGYTKNLVRDFGDACNIIIMCWAPMQTSAWHGHEGSKCFVKVLTGELRERRTEYPVVERKQSVSCSTLVAGEVTYIDDDVGLHKVTNTSSTEPAVSLHIYVPAYKQVRIFDTNDQNEGDTTLTCNKTMNVTFDNL